MKKSPLDIAFAFVDRINSHDAVGLVALMTEDHRFVDGLGQEVLGREQMERGWRGYFAWFPDYSIKVDNAFSDSNVVALFGTAQGTYSANRERPAENHWEIPAAWKAIIRNQRVAEWHVYADNEPVWKIMGVKRY
ncbi:MAG TPA: nuclear transport factor 2 family protein [Terriglobales bacterium]|jgi:ketosteroid isomerase-like protein|nr:nuclear transport factor 2 family protein [Terriglobales bacterium]